MNIVCQDSMTTGTSCQDYMTKWILSQDFMATRTSCQKFYDYKTSSQGSMITRTSSQDYDYTSMVTKFYDKILCLKRNMNNIPWLQGIWCEKHPSLEEIDLMI